MSKTPFILISAGGTGGHMSPASALASDLTKRGVRVEIVTDTRGSRYTSMFMGIPVHIVKSGTAHAGIIGKIKGSINLIWGIMQGFVLVRKLAPDAVIGFGGYPSVPAVYAAQMLGIPTGLHEQNAIIGKANVFLAPKARFLALSLPLPDGMNFSVHITSKSTITGNPVRPEIIALKDVPYPSLEGYAPFNIFVMGGSLGATVFSRVVPKALSNLSVAQKKRLSVVQQCREADLEEARAIYDKSGIKDVTLAPFFDDVDKKLAKAHLFIGRSGASTVAEINIAGRPAIYVPYPHHKDQQQKRNAASVVDKGGAWIIEEKDFTSDALQERLEVLFDDSQALQRAAAHAKGCGLPAAAQDLSDLCLKIID
jgi:UDP-N-acetylglucosamine--N-acetylmuramyl-(pentapeptide) pyrophosphoryl-undecaprenol N-acetylglucosamine transferase